tara:strand:+ start:1009 stop:1215 length:207 start_codon:yes stop_codon:yes gene_type:complete
VRRKINGNISKTKDGEFNKASDIMKFVLTRRFLKKSSSLRIFRITIKLKVIKNIKKNDLINRKVINFI